MLKMVDVMLEQKIEAEPSLKIRKASYDERGREPYEKLGRERYKKLHSYLKSQTMSDSRWAVVCLKSR